ncbi:chaoptin-like [Pararge aegeria]|uniref:chaoptin-like n=1 Tax=Pararge aegeria TaxID=116150 RepID=UPI0019CFD427|nr:chaoptin-like [Pararge aegeria]
MALLQLIVLVLSTILGIKGQCTLKDIPKINNLCSAEVNCSGTTENLITLVKKQWNCIRHRMHYYYNNERDYNLDSSYNLYVYVSNVDIDISEDYLTGVTDLRNNVKTLVVENGNLVSIGATLTGYSKLANFSLTYNKVETINLRELSGESMKTVNVSHNSISKIEVGPDGITLTSVINTIDLSYNALESIPNNCFAMFPHLRYLNLTSNKLFKFDILTFEGITKLETLQLSHNKISEIGQNFARFMRLKDLTLDFNQLTTLTDFNFRTLVSLEKLNLSSNRIKHIENKTLATLINLEQLDLSHNEIYVIHQTLFESNINLHKLSISHNNIENIERGAFRKTNISYFNIQNNYISGSIEYDTFLGISVESLDLSNGRLKELGDKAFSHLGPNLRYLNLSTNLIENITQSAFQSLKMLYKLDLSHNNLINIDYNTSDLVKLTEYHLECNKIEKVIPKMFNNLTNLIKLDLSQNEINDIEFNSFVELVNLKEFNVSNNNFVKSLTSNIFRGLHKVETLDLSNTRLMHCLNGSFSSMDSLNYLNLSHSQLETIEYETFKETGSISIIDLSYNMLENFYINTSNIEQLSELYLNHNKLKNITRMTFKNLRLLKKLNLACNNIFYIDSSSLQSLSHLNYLDLSSNYNLAIKGDVFNNLFISQVILRNIRHQFSFENTMNSSISTLILTNCEIEDMNSVFVYNINKILKLDVSSNKIKTLNKGSFQNMGALNWLDISFNMISTIQPGTFITNNMINTLNLYSNNLRSLQFGVLDGLVNLRVLNLSNNEIDTFAVNLLHNSPNLNKLFFDNNNLVSMDFRSLSKTSVELITIGGNSIPCDTLADWKKINNDSLNVTGARLDFDSENIYGISCKGKISSSRKEIQNENNNINLTSEVVKIKDIVGQLYNYLRLSENETFSKIIAVSEKILDNNKLDDVNFNTSQMILKEQLNNFLNEKKNKSDSVTNDIQLIISLLEKNNYLTELGNIKKNELLQIPISNEKYENVYSTDIVPKSNDTQPLEVKLNQRTLTDMKILLYFIATCLAIVVLFHVVAIIHKYVYRQTSRGLRINNAYNNRQSVVNGLEMD